MDLRNKKGQFTSNGLKGNTFGFQKGHKVHLGKKHSRKTKKKMSLIKKLNPSPTQFKKGHIGYKAMLGKTGELCPAWKGGKSFEPYTTNWTKTLKRSIRERDHYTCQLCGRQQEDIAFSVHHIDYNKDNCNPKNLITLCRSCHPKTNYNRDYWIKYFNDEK